VKRTACLLALVACGSSASSSNPAPDGSPPTDAAVDSSQPEAGPSTNPDAQSRPPSDAGSLGETGTTVPPFDAGPAPPCVDDAGPCATGTWESVTPAGVDLVDPLDCSNYGVSTVQVDPQRPWDVYVNANCQGIWKSTDYGTTWTGPINTGTGGAAVGDSAGGITIAPGTGGGPPILYFAAIRGSGIGFWRSTDGGTSWTNYNIAPASSSRQDMYAPVVDPYDPNHLLMAGHEQDVLVESTDGGQTWTNITLASGMLENGGTADIFFVNTGLPFSTRVTWLWMGQASGGTYGTWRTSDGGMTWAQVDHNEHPHGGGQIYQPDTSGVVFAAGVYSTLGWGVLRSIDFGSTWAHVGLTGNESVVFGTSKSVYAMYGWAIGEGQVVDPSLEIAPPPATGTWTATPTPTAMSQGPNQVTVTSDGTHSIVFAACYNAGVWRFVEP
jgi:hypothetical protein